MKTNKTKEISLCKSCGCMTHTKIGTIYICGKCNKDRRFIVKGDLNPVTLEDFWSDGFKEGYNQSKKDFAEKIKEETKRRN